MRADRHGRHGATPVDRRRRPSTGYRTRSRAAFEELVDSAIDTVPPELLEYLENVQITVEETPAHLGLADEVLLGLYQGVPRTERHPDAPLLPDRITVFRRPHELRCRSWDELRALVRTTIVHEIAHHLGIDDDRLDELGWS